MKINPRRQRSDSPDAAVTAAQAAALDPIQPPDHVRLREGDVPFWIAIIKARPRDTWTDSDLSTAAVLARAKADVEKLQAEVEVEGFTIKNNRGNEVVNPKHKLLETLTRRVLALSRGLHVHAEAVVGRSRDAGNALKNERQAALDLQGTDDDDLIPRLRLVG